MIVQEIDGVRFRLESSLDLTWIKRYGTVFSAIDGTGSGCICFGIADGQDRYFVKIAGVGTVEAELSPKESVELLKNGARLYQVLEHPALVELIGHYPFGGYYVAVFRWAEGECLFDHWNFSRYDKGAGRPSPRDRFKALPTERKLAVAKQIFSFLETVARKGYVAVDFYDGSLLYDFQSHRVTICDIDLFRRQPAVNDMGADYWGTKRLKAPEEYIRGAVIDERTNVFTIGALLFDFFGTYTCEEVQSRYTHSRFLPCAPERWTLGKGGAYRAVLRAVEPDREARYESISAFHQAFREAVGQDCGHF